MLVFNNCKQQYVHQSNVQYIYRLGIYNMALYSYIGCTCLIYGATPKKRRYKQTICIP